jgi:hypothetical protein
MAKHLVMKSCAISSYVVILSVLCTNVRARRAIEDAMGGSDSSEKLQLVSPQSPFNLQSALEAYGHCVVKDVTVWGTHIVPNPLVSGQMVELIKQNLKVRFGLPTPRHGFAKLSFLPLPGCQVEDSTRTAYSLIVEHNANIEFFGESAYRKKMQLDRSKIESGEASKLFQYRVDPLLLVPYKHGSPLPKISLFGIFWRLFHGEGHIYSAQENPDEYDVFDRNCFHFVEAFVGLTGSDDDLRNFQGTVERTQPHDKLQQAFRAAQKQNGELLGTGFKRALVGLASSSSSSRPSFGNIEQTLLTRINV